MPGIVIVGCGLIGTSVGLALRDSELGPVFLADTNPLALKQSVGRGAGEPWDGREQVDLAVVAVPPRQTAREVIRLQSLKIAQTYTHVASIQAHVQAEIEAWSPDVASVVGGHPLAGRELSGPAAAMADLFVGRPWAICAGESSSTAAVLRVKQLASACSAIPLELSASAHDRAVALLSHLPHVLASSLAGLLTSEPEPAAALQLFGPGLLDSTRLAAGDADLWTEILSVNASEVAPRVRALSDVLIRFAVELDAVASGAGESDAIRELLRSGNAGRDLIPVKRGELAASFTGVRVEVADEPGRLAALLVCAGEAGVNVEDVHVEHLPGRPRGVIELLVAPTSVSRLREALAADDWRLLG